MGKVTRAVTDKEVREIAAYAEAHPMRATKAKGVAKRTDWTAIAEARGRENQELRTALAQVRSLIAQHFTGVESVIEELPVGERETHIGVAHRVAGEALRTPQT